MQPDPELTSVSQPMAPPHLPQSQPSSASLIAPVQCPHCGSVQFFGGKKISAMGWILYSSALVNIPISALLMFVFIGFLTIFLTPVLALIGFFACRKHVNTCARCKREF